VTKVMLRHWTQEIGLRVNFCVNDFKRHIFNLYLAFACECSS